MIRLQRVGRKHEPVFRLVLTDSKNSTKSGRFLEILGNFDARRSDKAVFKDEKVKHWISQGAKLSDTVHNLLVERKVIEGKKINNLPKKKPQIDEKALAEEKAKAAEAEVAAKAQEEVKEEASTVEEETKADEPNADEPKEEVVA